MGVIKNLMVRICGDASGATKAFKQVGSSSKSAKETVQKSSSSLKKAIQESFRTSVPTIKEYTQKIKDTKTAHQTATQNVDRLQDVIAKLQSSYDTVKNATAGLDLYKPFTELVIDAEKALISIESKRRKLEAELQALASTPKGSNSKKATSIQAELDQLAKKSRTAQLRMADLGRVADMLGETNIGYASAQGLQQLQQQINATEQELRTTQFVADETGRTLKAMGVGDYIGQALEGVGVAAAQATQGGVQKLRSGLKSLGTAVGRKITSLPAKLRSIGSSASASCGGLGKMVKSIRNIGVASLGMRVASSMFGRLRSIINSYISQNEELNASVESMKNQLGQALLPAINLVLAAMQRLMPVVTAVSNGINSVLTSLFGDMSKTTAAIKNAADEANSVELYGFDQITKASESSSNTASSNSTEGEQSALVQKLTGWIQKLKSAFVAGDWAGLGKNVGDGINSAFAALDNIDVGAKVGGFINNLNTTVHSLFSTIDFKEIGTTLGAKFTDIVNTVDWDLAGRTIGAVLLALPSVVVGFVLSTDWQEVGQGLSEMLSAALQTGTDWIANTDWLHIGAAISDLIAGVNWGQLATDLFEFLGTAIGACVAVLWGFIDDAVDKIGDYFTTTFDECGGDIGKTIVNILADVVEGLLNSLISAVNALTKGINNVLSPIGEKVGISLSIPAIPDVKLPRAAKGTIVSGATDLTVGEDGTEAVVPLERHTEWLDVLASKLAVKIGGSGAGATSMTFQFILGNRKVTEYFIKDINQITQENGVCPIKV